VFDFFDRWTHRQTQERLLWRRRPAGGFGHRIVAESRRRDAGATKTATLILEKIHIQPVSALTIQS
jgi:hypothetical protein